MRWIIFPQEGFWGTAVSGVLHVGMSFIFTSRGTLPAPLQNIIDTGWLFNFFAPWLLLWGLWAGPPPALRSYDLLRTSWTASLLQSLLSADLLLAFSPWLTPDCFHLHIQVFHYFKKVSFCYTFAYLFVLFLKNTNYVLYFFPLSLFVWQNCHPTAVISPQMSVRQIQLWFLEGFYLFSFVFCGGR